MSAPRTAVAPAGATEPDRSDVVPARAARGVHLGVTGWVALGGLALMVLMAVFASVLTRYSPDSSAGLLDSFRPPSGAHWLGTDFSGRDIATRLIYGARTSLLGPLAIIAISLVVGIPLALTAAWCGGWVAFTITRLLDVIFAIPGLLLAILAIALFGPGLWAAVIALGIAYLPFAARLAFAAAEQERRLQYVQVLQVQGHGGVRIAGRHLLRNLAPILAGQATVAFAYALIDLASLSFLGLAVQAPQSDWGVLVSDRDSLLQHHPLQVIAAGTAIVVTVLCLFVLGARLSGERPSVRRWLRCRPSGSAR